MRGHLLSRSTIRLAVSPYSIFLQRTKRLFRDRPVTERGKLLSKKYHSLSVTEWADIHKEAARTKPFKRRNVSKKNPPKRTQRALHDYQKFVQANYDRFASLPPVERLGAIAKEWHAIRRKTNLAVSRVAEKSSTRAKTSTSTRRRR